MTSRWYNTSDSEREQLGWRVPGSTSRAAERALRKQRAEEANKDYTDTDTDLDTSARDTDDDSLLENMAVAARRATRAKPGYRRWRRPERGDRSRIDAAQRRWDAAMATPLSSGGDLPLGGDDDECHRRRHWREGQGGDGRKRGRRREAQPTGGRTADGRRERRRFPFAFSTAGGALR